jgi:hypothetical protein
MKTPTREEFKKLTGEYPEDVIGEDWKNEMEDFVNAEEPNEYFHEGHQIGGCFYCKMD